MMKLFIKPYNTVHTLLFLRDKEEKEIFPVGKHLHQGWLEEMRLMQLTVRFEEKKDLAQFGKEITELFLSCFIKKMKILKLIFQKKMLHEQEFFPLLLKSIQLAIMATLLLMWHFF